MTGRDLRRVAHIVPAMVIGGVEVAIARSHGHLNENVDYRIYFVRKRGNLDCGQRHVSRLLWSSLTGSWRPDVVVTSLWWSHPFGALLRRFGVSWIAFFHNCGFTGRIQRAILQSAWRRADTRLVDSEATGAFFRDISDRNYRVVPYIFPEAAPAGDWPSRKHDFVWVGRPVAAKRTDLVAAFMKELARLKPQGSLCLIVAGAVPAEFRNLDLGPGWTISTRESLQGDGVRQVLADSRFFLLTSDFEGMSMVTIEAVFAACVPVVRVVGELNNYIGDRYELTISDVDAAGLSAAAQRVSERWSDAGFATATINGLKDRIAAYSTYEKEFLSAVTQQRRQPPA